MKKTLKIALIAMTFGIFTALTFDYLKEKCVHVYENQPVAGSLWWDDGMVEPIPVEGYLRGYRSGIDLVCMSGSADANDCLVPYSTAPLRLTSELLWENDGTINITGSRPITIVCDDIDTSNWFKATGPLIERIEHMEQMIEAMHAVICEAPDPPAIDWYTNAPTHPIGTYYIHESKMLIDISDPTDELITYGPEPGPAEGYLRWDHNGDENLEIYTGSEWISTGVKP